MNKINANDPAFPTDVWYESRNGGFVQEGTNPGLSIRAELASRNLVGYISHQGYGHDFHLAEAVKWSVEASDALIEALNTPSKP